MFFQHFLFQMKSKEYNPELEVLVTRYPCPALAAEWYPRRPGLPARHCPSPPPLLPERWEQLVTQSTVTVMVLTDGKTDVFQNQKERILSCPKIELGSWELVAGWREQSFRLLPSPSLEVTQASAHEAGILALCK